MIYRIHHDDHYLAFEIPTREVLDKLGRAHPFHIDRTPISYADIWNTPLHIKFRPPENFTQEFIPDLSEVDGKLFLNQKAYDLIKGMLKQYGEFLPITYDGGTGYLFNILTIAEDMDGLNEQLIGHDKHGNLENFGFHEEIMGKIPIFRAKLDSYQGIFCNEAIKKRIADTKLSGVFFHVDLANPIGESYGTVQ